MHVIYPKINLKKKSFTLPIGRMYSQKTHSPLESSVLVCKVETRTAPSQSENEMMRVKGQPSRGAL